MDADISDQSASVFFSTPSIWNETWLSGSGSSWWLGDGLEVGERGADKGRGEKKLDERFHESGHQSNQSAPRASSSPLDLRERVTTFATMSEELEHPLEESEPEANEDITFLEGRVLGCLLEKEATTPDHYPLTLNSLMSACNQRSSRDPQTDFDEETVERGLTGLRDKKFAVKYHMSGSRVPKYKHTIDRVLNLSPDQQALICVLLLRGVQTAGELNQRTERIHRFGSVEAVEHSLQTLIDYPAGALVKRFPSGSGRRVVTYGHLLSGEPETSASSVAPAAAGGVAPVSAAQIVLEEEASWRKKLEDEVTALRGELGALREEFAEFRHQFD